MDRSVIEKIARIARWNGGSIAVVAGLGAVFSLAGGDWVGAGFAAVVTVAGAQEFKAGRGLADPATGAGPALDPGRARQTLVRSELVVLATIVLYSLWRLATADVAAELARMPEAERALLASLTAGDMLLLEQMFTLALKVTYSTLIAVSLVYQGGLAWWYSKTLRSPA